MRACCNKQEDNFITYNQNREKNIERVREWEKLNPEKRKQYTINYYKSEQGKRKKKAQRKRYREKLALKKQIIKLQQENQKLKILVECLYCGVERNEEQNELLYKILFRK